MDKIDDTWKLLPVSASQEELIQQILKDFPESTDSYEYQDYLSSPSKGSASEFITRSVEDNYDRIGKRNNHVRYIAHRPGAERFGTHGLFTDANIPIDLNAVAEEVGNHQGILMTEVLSVRREDATRLGFDKGEVWRDMLRSQTTAMAQAMNIPLADLRWYAAFHNESHHPHCHIIAYSVGKQPYMSQQNLMKLKASFAHEIFKQDLLTTYEEQTHQRDSLTAETREQVQRIVQNINSGSYENANLEQMLRELSMRLQKAQGKKVYGYLPQPARNLVNNIVDELAKDARLSELYDLWYQQRNAVIRTYQDAIPERLPLSQNKTFHSIKNIVVSEAMHLFPDAPTAVNTAVDLMIGDTEVDADSASDGRADFRIPLISADEESNHDAPISEESSDRARDQTNQQATESRHYQTAVGLAGFRLLSSLARMLQENIEKEQKQSNQIDRKLRRIIEEKKQAQGLKMG